MRRGFSIMDVLVSMAVITLLVGLLIPSISKINETGHRVVCQSNLRQIGTSLLMYADTYRGALPPSVFLPLNGMMGGGTYGDRSDDLRPQDMLTLRLGEDWDRGNHAWDGLGLLYKTEFLPAPKVFFCPSHTGDHVYGRYAQAFGNLGGEIVANYHYRGEGPMVGPGGPTGRTTRNLFRIDPAATSLLADGMRTVRDINHDAGANFFRADQSVLWFPDVAGQITGERAFIDADPSRIDASWDAFDRFVPLSP